MLGGTFTPSLSLGGGVVRNFFPQDRTQRQDIFALPPSSKLTIALGIGTGLPGLPRWLLKTKRLARFYFVFLIFMFGSYGLFFSVFKSSTSQTSYRKLHCQTKGKQEGPPVNLQRISADADDVSAAC